MSRRTSSIIKTRSALRLLAVAYTCPMVGPLAWPDFATRTWSGWKPSDHLEAPRG